MSLRAYDVAVEINFGQLNFNAVEHEVHKNCKLSLPHSMDKTPEPSSLFKPD